jgi:hypothetical protein
MGRNYDYNNDNNDSNEKNGLMAMKFLIKSLVRVANYGVVHYNSKNFDKLCIDRKTRGVFAGYQ